MALRIVRSSDPLSVENIILTLYAAPGLWKTSIAQTAKDPLTLDFDKGIYRAFNRRDAVQIASWSDVANMTAEDLAPYSTVVVDTAGRALDVLSADIIVANPKAGKFDGSLSLQGFGTLKSRFAQWVSFLQSIKKDLVLVAHMDEQKNGDDTLERIDAQGASKNEIYKKSDAMCRIRLDGKDQRYLDFDPRQGGFGKNPAQLPKIPIPDLKDNPQFLARVIDQIKASINAMTAEQAEAVKEQEQWNEAVSSAANPEDFTLLSKLAGERKYDAGMKKALIAAAEAKGFEFDKGTKAFVAKEEVAA